MKPYTEPHWTDADAWRTGRDAQGYAVYVLDPDRTNVDKSHPQPPSNWAPDDDFAGVMEARAEERAEAAAARGAEW